VRDLVLDENRVRAFLATATEVNGTAPGMPFDDVLAQVRRLGLPPGGVVVISLSNSVRLLRLYFAALLSGLVPLAIAPAAPAARLRGVTTAFGACAVIAGRLDPTRFGATAVAGVGDAEAVVLPGAGAVCAPGEALLSTSGTSGSFTACVHRVSSLLRNADRHADAVGLTRDDTVLVNLPVYYSYALVAQVLAAYLRGARVVVAGPPFTPAGYGKAVRRHDVTQSSITPTIARQLVSSTEPLPRTLRVLTVGGDRIAEEHVAALLAARPGGELYLTYGLTEAGPRVSTLAAHAEPASRHASVGLPLPGVTVTLRDTDRDDGDTGELVVASDTVLVRKITDGGRGHATHLRPGVIATGDLFTIDRDGYLFFRGRLSDFVVIRGEKVLLAGVRAAANAIPGVVSAEPTTTVDDDGDTVLELRVMVVDPTPDMERLVRKELSTVLLHSERPRRITVTSAGNGEFRK
jgi:acyl-CoA synthetase (AMP-forming)/AMP-acid ligase II